jgi:hypothetical protein
MDIKGHAAVRLQGLPVGSSIPGRESIPSPAGLTRGSIFFVKLFCEDDGLHRNSGLPELGSIERRKSGKPDLRCQARQ